MSKQTQQTNSSAIWGLCLGIAALLFSPLCLPGLICSIVGLSKADKELQGSGRGMAVAGICLSVISGIFMIWMLTTFVNGVAKTAESITSRTTEMTEAWQTEGYNECVADPVSSLSVKENTDLCAEIWLE